MDNEYLQSLYTPEQQLLLFGDANYFNNQNNNNLPFSVGDRLFNEFNNAGAVPNQTIQPYISPTYLMKQQLGMVPTGITASSAAIPFGSPVDIAQGFVKGSPSDKSFSPLGIDTSFGVANEPDEKEEKSGIAKLFEFLQKFSPVSMITKGIGSMFDFSDSPRYRPAGMGVYGYTPQELDRMNALGGYYSEPMRAYRRNVNRISNLMQRAAAGKNYSQKNLDRLMNQAGMGDVDTRGMIDSIKASADLGYGRGGGRDFDSGRDYSSSPGAIAGDMEYGEE